MSEFVDSMGTSMFFAFTVALCGIGLWWLIDKNARRKFKEKQKKKILTNDEYFSIVFGILFIVQGSAMITIFAPTMNTEDWSKLGSAIGMFLIIVGVLLELRTHTNFKKSIIGLQERIEKLEGKS